MNKSIMAVITAVSVAGMAWAAETDYEWKFEDTNRSELIAGPVVGSQTVAAPWTCPAWIEAYVEGGIFRSGLLIIFR